MSPFLRSYLTVVWFGLASFLVAGLLLGISALIRPNNPNAEKLLTYESGVDPVGDGWSQSQIRYYVFALLFVSLMLKQSLFSRGQHSSSGTECLAL
jgi:NADH-quinone oxidoreductase subunit A